MCCCVAPVCETLPFRHRSTETIRPFYSSSEARIVSPPEGVCAVTPVRSAPDAPEVASEEVRGSLHVNPASSWFFVVLPFISEVM